ncbi:MAG: hypothetical protein ACRC5V_08600 [Aeromonas sp.]
MKFSDLMSLNKDEAGNILIADLKVKLPNTPIDVLEQFYADHGRKYDFQVQYADLNISNLEWSLVALSYNKIAESSIFLDFRHFTNICAKKSEQVALQHDWSKIGSYSQQIIQCWKSENTWSRPPIMLLTSSNYHLVEGHSRFGCLKGLVISGVIPPEILHQVWLAKIV